MNPWTDTAPILVTCPKGIAPWLAGEIRGLGFPAPAEGEAAVETEGSLSDTMRLNLHLRTAHRVLWRLAAFRAEDPKGLYAGIRALPWEGILHERGEHAYLSVTATADTPSIS